MDRRTLLKLGAAASAMTTLPSIAAALYAPVPKGWRTFELTTTVSLPRDGAAAQVWVPVPTLANPLWSQPGQSTWTSSTENAGLVTDPETGVGYVQANWPAGETAATLTVVSTIAVQNRSIDLENPNTGHSLSAGERARHLAPTDLIPTDGIVAETAAMITDGATSDLDKARRIYDWVVESTERNPETRGCGLGDIASMLQTGDLTGKCADLNALYVGLARAAGLPARDLYGIRVAPSAFGYKSLGAGSADVTKAQHCRAEVFLEDFGWVPVDPADVRKVVLEEPPKTLSLADSEVRDVRAALFGASEGNWVVYNDAHDVVLAGAEDAPLPFLMYPHAEINGVAQDELDAGSFVYDISVREIGA